MTLENAYNIIKTFLPWDGDGVEDGRDGAEDGEGEGMAGGGTPRLRC